MSSASHSLSGAKGGTARLTLTLDKAGRQALGQEPQAARPHRGDVLAERRGRRGDDDADQQQDPAPHQTQEAPARQETAQPTGSVGGSMRFSAFNASNASKTAMTTMHSLIAHAKRPALVIAASAALAAVPATAGAAVFGIQPGSFTASATSTQAGAHADFTTGFLLTKTRLETRSTSSRTSRSTSPRASSAIRRRSRSAATRISRTSTARTTRRSES